MSQASGATLTVLGAGSILPRIGYGAAGYALRFFEGGPVTLLDCGPGSLRGLPAAGIGLEEIRSVVFSHYHVDHCLDLFALLFARKNPRLEGLPRLALYGPVGLQALVAGAPHALSRYAADPLLDVHEVGLDGEGRGGFELDGAHFACQANGHNAEALSWRLDCAPEGAASRPWSLGYTGDTGPNPRVAELLREVDLAVIECSFADDEAQSNHLTPTSAGELARDAHARRVLLTHFYPGLEPQDAGRVAARVYEGPIELARDGAVHPLER